jgi:hypothetical protein
MVSQPAPTKARIGVKTFLHSITPIACNFCLEENTMSTQNDSDKILDTINTILSNSLLALLHDAKARTHGGEWCGPCPLCKRDGNGGGNDRLLVWPQRPLDGQGHKDDPVFWCRRCGRSGDLPQFIQFALDVSYPEARGYLGLANGKTMAQKPRKFTPTISETGAPFVEWQSRAFAEIGEGVKRLWGDSSVDESVGENARKYLAARKLTEETLRIWQVGWQPDPERYDDPTSWGLDPHDGKVRVPRGVMIPELHRAPDGLIECWSISVRRPPGDLANEEFETGRKPAKYWAIKGSEKSLLGTPTIHRGLPLVLVEGHFDALTVWQEARDIVGVCATQSVAGARDPRALGFWIPQASGVILCFDPDTAGQEAAEYWENILPCRVWHTPMGGDLNAMLMRGENVRSFIERGIRKLHVLYPELTPSQSPQDAQQIPQNKRELSVTVQEETEAPLPHVAQETVDVLWSQGCHVCGSQIMEFVEYEGAVRGYCEEHTPSRCCDGEVVVRDYTWRGYCRKHIFCYQLVERGKLLGFPPLYIERWEGWVPDLDCGEFYDRHWEIICDGGEMGYAAFCQEATLSQVWGAVREASALKQGFPATKRPDGKRVCSHWHCQRNVDRPLVMEHPNNPKPSDEEEVKPKPPIIIKGRTAIVGDQRYGWCPRCTDAALLLAFAEERDWQAWIGDTSATSVEAGAEAWLHFCQHSEAFNITVVFDSMRRSHKDQWKALQNLLV